ncbi:MAG: RNA polymerase sigma factor, partial [Longimicrobiales bacterium]
AALLTWGLARLRPNQSRLMEAFHIEGRSVREIARDEGLSERAVEGRLRRARQKLRKQLEPVVQSLEEGGGLQ